MADAPADTTATPTTDPGPGERSGISSEIAAELIDGVAAGPMAAPGGEELDVQDARPVVGLGDEAAMGGTPPSRSAAETGAEDLGARYLGDDDLGRAS